MTEDKSKVSEPLLLTNIGVQPDYLMKGISGLPTPVSEKNSEEMTFDPQYVSGYRFATVQNNTDCTAVTYSNQLEASVPLSLQLVNQGKNTLCLKLISAIDGLEKDLRYTWNVNSIGNDFSLSGLPEVDTTSVELTVTPVAINVKSFQYAIESLKDSYCELQEFSQEIPIQNSVELSLERGFYSMCIKFVDNNNRKSKILQKTFEVIAPPTVYLNLQSVPFGSVVKDIDFQDLLIEGANLSSFRYSFGVGDATRCPNSFGNDFLTPEQPFSIGPIQNPLEVEYTLCLEGRGEYNQLSEIKTYTFSVDRTAPTFTLLNAPQGVIADRSVAFELTTDNSVLYFVNHFPGNVDCQVVANQTGFSIVDVSTNLSFESFSGNNTICIWTQDAVGNNSALRTVRYTADFTAPRLHNLSVDVQANRWEFAFLLANIETRVNLFYTFNRDSNAACPNPNVDIAAYNNVGNFNQRFTRRENFGPAGQSNKLCAFVQDLAGNRSPVIDRRFVNP